MKIGIVTSTYRRDDGKTIFFLKRALDSIFNQTHKEIKVFLIGDKYENENEILSLLSNYDSTKIFFENLPIAKERDNYKTNKNALWSYGGVNAVNYGIEKSLSEGYNYICHLDHDDWWYPNHIEEIVKCINLTSCDWVCTKSTFGTPNRYLPLINVNGDIIKFLPRPCQLIHSSVCMNFKKIPLRYRDIFSETGKVGLPSDADLWARTSEFIINNNLNSCMINILTCRHDEEGYERDRK